MAVTDPELDVAAAAMVAEAHLRATTRAGVVDVMRLAGRARDRNDLIGLAEIHGELPEDPIPGLDT